MKILNVIVAHTCCEKNSGNAFCKCKYLTATTTLAVFIDLFFYISSQRVTWGSVREGLPIRFLDDQISRRYLCGSIFWHGCCQKKCSDLVKDYSDNIKNYYSYTWSLDCVGIKRWTSLKDRITIASIFKPSGAAHFYFKTHCFTPS